MWSHVLKLQGSALWPQIIYIPPIGKIHSLAQEPPDIIKLFMVLFGTIISLGHTGDDWARIIFLKTVGLLCKYTEFNPLDKSHNCKSL